MKKARFGKILIGLGFFLLFAFGAAGILGLKPQTAGDKGADTSPSGYSLVFRFLSKLGYGLAQRSGPAYLKNKEGAVLFLEYPEWGAQEYDALLDWVEGGGLAFCFGGKDWEWLEALEYQEESGMLRTGILDARGSQAYFPFEGRVFFSSPPKSQSLAEMDGRPLMLSLPYGKGEFRFASDSRLLSNEVFRQGGEHYAILLNAFFLPAFGRRLISYEAKQEGSGAGDPIQALFRGAFLPISIQFLLIYLFISLALASRFGSGQVWNPRERRSSREHVDAIGRFYLRALKPRAAGPSQLAEDSGRAYFRLELEALLRRGPGTIDAELANAAALLSSQVGRAGDILELLNGLDQVTDAQMRKRAAARDEIIQAIKRSLS